MRAVGRRPLAAALLLLTTAAAVCGGCGRGPAPSSWVKPVEPAGGASPGASPGVPPGVPPAARPGVPPGAPPGSPSRESPGARSSAPPGGGGRAGLPEVLDRVPTRDKVVFLTYDDGAERDPEFVDMVRERRLPVTLFLTDSVAGPGYGHFARLRSVGATLQNHTLDHAALRGLPYAGQRAEICGQQNKLASRFGIRPTLLRPPYGMYDDTTLRAAADCGVRSLILFRASATDTHTHFTSAPERLLPGDVITLTPHENPGPTLVTRTIRLLKEIEANGLRPARLEDHLRADTP
ncbi:polysaccharide deacetylase family protein [Streptomyces sp. NPDC088789]|uniref:polysaccharide deacetylase family protein n=1 Tax=Streptomyces sp. NPDC088789 TaxID=3365899 RepID=UPI00382C2D9A